MGRIQQKRSHQNATLLGWSLFSQQDRALQPLAGFWPRLEQSLTFSRKNSTTKVNFQPRLRSHPGKGTQKEIRWRGKVQSSHSITPSEWDVLPGRRLPRWRRGHIFLSTHGIDRLVLREDLSFYYSFIIKASYRVDIHAWSFTLFEGPNMSQKTTFHVTTKTGSEWKHPIVYTSMHDLPHYVKVPTYPTLDQQQAMSGVLVLRQAGPKDHSRRWDWGYPEDESPSWCWSHTACCPPGFRHWPDEGWRFAESFNSKCCWSQGSPGRHWEGQPMSSSHVSHWKPSIEWIYFFPCILQSCGNLNLWILVHMFPLENRPWNESRFLPMHLTKLWKSELVNLGSHVWFFPCISQSCGNLNWRILVHMFSLENRPWNEPTVFYAVMPKKWCLSMYIE